MSEAKTMTCDWDRETVTFNLLPPVTIGVDQLRFALAYYGMTASKMRRVSDPSGSEAGDPSNADTSPSDGEEVDSPASPVCPTCGYPKRGRPMGHA